MTVPNQLIIDRGRKAEIVLSIPEFKALFAEVEAEIFNKFRKTNVSESIEREHYHTVLYGLDLIIKRFEGYVRDADIEIKKISAIDKDE